MKEFSKILILACLIISKVSCGNMFIDSVKKAIDFIKPYYSLVNDFANLSDKTVVTTQVFKQGYTYYREKSDTMLYSGVSDDNLPAFTNFLSKLIKLPPQYDQLVLQALNDIVVAKAQGSIYTEILYEKTTGGTNNYVLIIGERDEEKGLTNWLIGSVDVKFKLADELIAIRTTRSAFFGLWKEEKVTYKKQKHAITTEELLELQRYFQLGMFERFAQLLKIDIAISEKDKKFLDYLE
jgi:hypothetical protein